MTENIKKLKQLIDDSKTILVLQPEKPDTDSLSSSIALEHFLVDAGKKAVMYCQDKVPDYIRMIEGWDRVADEFPKQFDLTVLVDAGGPQMISRTLEKYQAQLIKKPFVIVDHHASREPMPFETINIIDPKCASATQLLFMIAKEFGWSIKEDTADILATGIYADTASFVWPSTTPETFEVMAELLRLGASPIRIYERKQDADAASPEIVKFKGRLLNSAEFFDDDQIAIVVVSPEDLKKYAEMYDPSALIVSDLRFAKGVKVVAVLRNYASSIHGNKIKISFRSRLEIAAPAAAHFGGGGHPQAAGCTVEGRDVVEVKQEVVKVLAKLIKDNEAAQHA